jgi:hypothetical protein
MKTALYVIAVCLLAACSEIRYMGIDTCTPAEITYPSHIHKILVASNAIPQPPDEGCEDIFMGTTLPCSIKADSAILDACRTLGNAFVEADYFDDVLLLSAGLRTDTAQPQIEEKLSPEVVQALCEDTGADAVITIDRLRFQTKKHVSIRPEGHIEGTLHIYIYATIRSYLPETAEPAISVLVADSIYLSDWGYSAEQLNNLFPNTEEALQFAARYIGEKAHTAFVPHWQNEQRWYYTGYGAQWKKASAYAAAEKWQEAATAWENLYNTTSSRKAKAKLASNLALVNELNGDLNKAHDYAKTASNILQEDEGENSIYSLFQSQYLQALQRRIRDDAKLNSQIRPKKLPN